jgi:hypothetical protein
MTDVRPMRLMRPCCMPRLKRRTATLDDGYVMLVATAYQATDNVLRTHNLNLHRNFPQSNPRNAYTVSMVSFKHQRYVRLSKSIQYSHEHGEPQLLCTKQCVTVYPPFSASDIVTISDYDERPGSLSCVSIGVSVNFMEHALPNPATR